MYNVLREDVRRLGTIFEDACDAGNWLVVLVDRHEVERAESDELRLAKHFKILVLGPLKVYL